MNVYCVLLIFITVAIIEGKSLYRQEKFPGCDPTQCNSTCLASGQCGYCDETWAGHYDCFCDSCGPFTQPPPTTTAPSQACANGYSQCIQTSLCTYYVYHALMCATCASTCQICLTCNNSIIPVEWTCSGIKLSYNNKNYCLYTEKNIFDKAEVKCQGQGTSVKTQGHLVAIHDAFENNYLKSELQKYNISQAWIGATADGVFDQYFTIWNDASVIDYQNFIGNTFNFDDINQLSMKASNGGWYSKGDDMNLFSFICQEPEIHK